MREYRAQVEQTGSDPQALWYRVPGKHEHWVSNSADPFLIGVLFFAMRKGGCLRIHGTVSPSLLRRLDEFQAAWSQWLPERYKRVEITADHEAEEPSSDSGLTVLAFSGGLDSCFSAWRHTRGNGADRADYGTIKGDGAQLGATLMVHGFDIPLIEAEAFERAATNSKQLVNSLGLELISIATNVRSIAGDWEYTHGAALAACLHLFRRNFSEGMIASSHTYGTLRIPWGSNPLTDPLLSTSGFPIVYDGAVFSRREKANAVAAWPEAMQRVRVCWEGPKPDRNCGRCSRCVGTAVCFAVEGREIPASLNIDSLEDALHGLLHEKVKPMSLVRFGELLGAARSSDRIEPWVGALERLVKRHRPRNSPGDVNQAIKKKVRALRKKLGNPKNCRLKKNCDSASLSEASGQMLHAGFSGTREEKRSELYCQLDDEINRRLNASVKFGLLISTKPYHMDPLTVHGFRDRYAVIKRFQQRTLELFRASLTGKCDPLIAGMVVGDLPGHLGRGYHRALTKSQHNTPVFFRTDELFSGKIAEIQCCGSGWGIAEQLRVLYDANPLVFGSPAQFPDTLAELFSETLCAYIGRDPVVHHLDQNASLPHDARYFIQRLREHGVLHYSYDGEVAPSDCNFIRSHDFITLPHHNYFNERMKRCEKGELFFDLPPSCLFDTKIIQAWPFWSKTRDWYDDDIRSLFPYTSIILPEGFEIAEGSHVSIEEFCSIPQRKRQHYIKYAGTDIAVNWGSKAVFLASTLTRSRCRELMGSIVADRKRGRFWIAQRSIRHSEQVTAFSRTGDETKLTAYVKYSGFYGPDGLMALWVLHRDSHKVHGSSDTIVSLVR
jgi:hypothetical protein